MISLVIVVLIVMRVGRITQTAAAALLFLQGCAAYNIARSAAPAMLAAKKKNGPTKAASGFGAARAGPRTLDDVIKEMPKRLPKDFSTPCACGSGTLYSDCCRPYHKLEKGCESPEICLRARYSAYAFRLVSFIMASTDTTSKEFKKDSIKWAKSMNHPNVMFDGYDFTGLQIGERDEAEAVKDGAAAVWLGSIASPNIFTVRKQNSMDAPIVSAGRSKFVEREGTWNFGDGVVFMDEQIKSQS